VCWSRSRRNDQTERQRTFRAKSLATWAELLIDELIVKDDLQDEKWSVRWI
jgi:hypothetical protein